MFEIAYTMHRGKQNLHQEDCILVNGALHRECMLPIAVLSLATDGALLDVADGVHSSPMPHRASRTVLEELTQAIQEHLEWLQAAFGAFYNLRVKLKNRVILATRDQLPALETITRNAVLLEEQLQPLGFGRDWLVPLFSTECDWNSAARVLTDQYASSNLLNAADSF